MSVVALSSWLAAVHKTVVGEEAAKSFATIPNASLHLPIGGFKNPYEALTVEI